MGDLNPDIPVFTDVNNREKILDIFDEYLDILDAVKHAEDRVELAQPARPQTFIVNIDTKKTYTKTIIPY